VSEDAFLLDLLARVPTDDPALVVPPGDDCAALALGADRLLLLAVDQLVGGRHYVLDGPGAASPGQAGRKLLARNLSDIAAMGGTPLYCLVAVALAPSQDEAWLSQFFDGVLGLAREFGVHMIGGDLARAPGDAVASLTIVGDVGGGDVCRRCGAHPGDLLYATGSFGGSLETGHHLSFVPRCREGRWLAESGAVTAMIDVSDGLLLDCARLCRMSGVTGRLDLDAVPSAVPGLARGRVLGDGEDYELLFTVAAERVSALRAWPFADVPLTRIGRIFPPSGVHVADMSGTPLDVAFGGYDHFKNSL